MLNAAVPHTGSITVVFVNPHDINLLGFSRGQKVDLLSLWDDGIVEVLNLA